METVNRDSDQELLKKSASDPEAFGVFYDRYFDKVLAYFSRRTSCSQTAADLTSETFAEALDGCHRYDASQGIPASWLFGIARHQLLQMLRKHEVNDRALQKLGIGRILLDDDTVERIESQIDARAKSIDLRLALQKLPRDMSNAVALRVGHNLPVNEVAARLGCSNGTVRVRVSRGLAKLAVSIHA